MTHSTTAPAQTIAVRTNRQRTWHRASNWSTTNRHVLVEVLAEVRRTHPERDGWRVITVRADVTEVPTYAQDYSASTPSYPVKDDFELPADLCRTEITVPEEAFDVDRLPANWNGPDRGQNGVIRNVDPETVRATVRQAYAEGRLEHVITPDRYQNGTGFFVRVDSFEFDGVEYPETVLRYRTKDFGLSEFALST
jgi:hypothetical protein